MKCCCAESTEHELVVDKDEDPDKKSPFIAANLMPEGGTPEPEPPMPEPVKLVPDPEEPKAEAPPPPEPPAAEEPVAEPLPRDVPNGKAYENVNIKNLNFGTFEELKGGLVLVSSHHSEAKSGSVIKSMKKGSEIVKAEQMLAATKDGGTYTFVLTYYETYKVEVRGLSDKDVLGLDLKEHTMKVKVMTMDNQNPKNPKPDPQNCALLNYNKECALGLEIRPGDEVIAVDDQTGEQSELTKMIRAKKGKDGQKGEKFTLTMRRHGPGAFEKNTKSTTAATAATGAATWRPLDTPAAATAATGAA